MKKFLLYTFCTLAAVMFTSCDWLEDLNWCEYHDTVHCEYYDCCDLKWCGQHDGWFYPEHWNGHRYYY
ncbi:MAG: hypothetical protein MJZ74_03615 [Muribaculaceae bacterium]|nr:hypothetical protein [Muribaculaceae bacterium]